MELRCHLEEAGGEGLRVPHGAGLNGAAEVRVHTSTWVSGHVVNFYCEMCS